MLSNEFVASYAALRRALKGLSAQWQLTRGEHDTFAVAFLDTFDWRLYAAGYTLAAENANSEVRLVLRSLPGAQTVVCRLPAVPCMADAIPKLPATEKLRRWIGNRRLLVRAAFSCERRTFGLASVDGEAIARLLVTQYRPLHGKRRGGFSVLELVELPGCSTGCQKLEGVLRAAVPELLHLADAVFRQSPVCPRSYRPKPDVPMTPDLPASAAMRLVFKHLFDVLRANETGVLQDLDVEFLHDFRVAIRRTRTGLVQMRSVLPEAQALRFRADFGWLGEITGRLRDLDVHLESLDHLADLLVPGDRSALFSLREYLLQERGIAFRELQGQLCSDRYRQLIRAWGDWLEHDADEAEFSALGDAGRPIVEVADRRLRKLFKRALREGRSLASNAPPECFHELRKTCKKLRYLMEFFQRLYPPNALERSLSQLKSLQELLGQMQDTAVQLEMLQQFQGLRPSAAPDPVLTSLIVRLDAAQAKMRADFPGRFERFGAKDNRDRAKRLFKTADRAAL